MDKETFKRLLSRYLDGGAPSNLRHLVDRWFNAYNEPTDKDVFGSSENEARIRDEVRGRLVRLAKPPRKTTFKKYIAYAAMFVVAASVAITIFNTRQKALPEAEFTTVTTDSRQKKKLVLPDSSTLWINTASSVRIPKKFHDSDERKVIVDEGEVFFDVASQRDRPFIVTTGRLSITVLGTAFNVRNYSKARRINVDVDHGLVRVRNEASGLDEELGANEGLDFDTRAFTYARGSVPRLDVGAWRKGIFELAEANIDEIAIVLKNLYGVQVLVEDPSIYQHRFTLTIRSTRSLDEAMRLICSIHGNHYKKEGNVIKIY